MNLPTKSPTSLVDCLLCHWLKCCRAYGLPDGFPTTIEVVVQFWVQADTRNDKILRHGQKVKWYFRRKKVEMSEGKFGKKKSRRSHSLDIHKERAVNDLDMDELGTTGWGAEWWRLSFSAKVLFSPLSLQKAVWCGVKLIHQCFNHTKAKKTCCYFIILTKYKETKKSHWFELYENKICGIWRECDKM